MQTMDVRIQIDRSRNQFKPLQGNPGGRVDRPHSSKKVPVVSIEKFWEKFWPTLCEAAAAANNAADFKKVLDQVSKETRLDQTAILNTVDQSEDALIHVAARHGNAEIVKLMVEKVPRLLRMKGFNGDTVWHIAAKTGKVFDELYNLCNDEFKEYLEGSSHGLKSINVSLDDLSLRDTNEEGNTALHEALIYRRKSMADLLVKADSELSLYVNERKKSALYLAAEAGYEETVKYMLEKATEASKMRQEDGKLKLKGKSIVHAAIMGKNRAVLAHILEGKAKLIERIHVEGREINRHLTKTKDEEGRNPLHWAASIGFLEGVTYLVDKIPMEKDKKQLHPIHWASMNGHVEVVKKLLQHHRNLIFLLTRDGQNVLHLAAKHGKHNVVSHILHNDKTSELASLLNKGDAQKNTPLHLATIHWHPKVVSALTWDNRVDLNSVNEEGLTALDAAVLNMNGFDSFRQWLTWQVLKAAGAPRVKSGKVLNAKRTASMESKPTNTSKQKRQKPISTVNYKITVRALFLVSIIVAMVSYETGSTKLAYVNSFDTCLGITSTIRHIKNHLFLFCNTVSMYTSIAVIVVLVQAHFGDANRAFSALRFAKPLVAMALTMATLALMPGVYPVGSKHYRLVDAVLTIIMAFLVCFATLFFPVCFPLPPGYRFLRYITYIPIHLMIRYIGDHLEE